MPLHLLHVDEILTCVFNFQWWVLLRLAELLTLIKYKCLSFLKIKDGIINSFFFFFEKERNYLKLSLQWEGNFEFSIIPFLKAFAGMTAWVCMPCCSWFCLWLTAQTLLNTHTHTHLKCILVGKVRLIQNKQKYVFQWAGVIWKLI